MSVSELFNNGSNHLWAELNAKSINFGGDNLDTCDKNIEITLTSSGALTGNVNVKVSKVGNICVFNSPTFVGQIVAPNTINLSVLPIKFRPIEPFTTTVTVLNDNTRQVGLLTVNTSGEIVVHATVGQSNFSGTGNCGLSLMTSITYFTI